MKSNRELERRFIMCYLLDAHTHTIASGHAYSTISEMVEAAKEKKLSLLGITEHAPKMPGTCGYIYFMNLKVVPRQYNQLKVLFGAEVNILDYQGNIDLDEEVTIDLDYLIASLHTPCIESGNETENTNAIIGAMKHPKVSIIGHPDDQRFPINHKALVEAAKEYHVLLEMNNSSLSPNSFRANAKENDLIILDYCKQYHVPVIAGSDAHINHDIGNFTYVKQLFEEINFPKELVANTSLPLFHSYINK